jgi:PAS domain S-box-containing protein
MPGIKIERREQMLSTLKIVGAYVLFGCLWILYSDELLASMVADKAVYTRWQTLKGWAFITVTAVMLYALISRSIATTRKYNEASLESEARFRRVVESNMIGIIFWNTNGQITDANDAFLKIVGHTREELLAGKVNWLEMTPQEQRQFDRRVRGERRTLGSSASYEKEYIRQDGHRVPVLIGVATLNKEEGSHIGFVLDMTARKRSEAKLLNSYAKLRALSAHLQSVREEERIRIAREIHDVLGQALTGLKMDAWWLIKRLSDPHKAVEREALLKKLETMSELLKSTIPSVRRLAAELRPGVLDTLGLVAAIEWQAKEFQDRTGVICQCSLPVEDVALSPDRSTAVFRIFQEILTNVARHADANRVEIKISEPDGHLVLEVKDNGRGIIESQISETESLGLLGMRERAFLFGGEVNIGPAPEKGTMVTVRIPFQRRNGSKPIDGVV